MENKIKTKDNVTLEQLSVSKTWRIEISNKDKAPTIVYLDEDTFATLKELIKKA